MYHEDHRWTWSGSDSRLKRKMYYGPGPPTKFDLSFQDLLQNQRKPCFLEQKLKKKLNRTNEILTIFNEFYQKIIKIL